MSTENKLVDERPATLAEHIQLIKDTTKQAAIVPHAWLGEWLKEAERQEQTIADLRARVEAQRGPGKVLTDEEVGRIAWKCYPHIRAQDAGRNADMATKRSAGIELLRYARDNGYLAPTSVSYAMSKDYEALYDHLCNGGEALAAVIYTGQEKGAKWLRAPELHTSTSLSRSINFGGIYVSEHGDHRAEFITSCTRLNLEWLAPAQPLDPDAHITDADAYLKAKIERAKDVDFDGIEAARNPTGWIPVEERLPENRATVLTFFRHGEQDICFFYDGNWSGHSASTVTHWMHLPSAP